MDAVALNTTPLVRTGTGQMGPSSWRPRDFVPVLSAQADRATIYVTGLVDLDRKTMIEEPCSGLETLDTVTSLTRRPRCERS